MATNLYTDAIADAKNLKLMAEESAKNKIIEAVTPRIRRLIEQELAMSDEEDLEAEEEADAEMEEEVEDAELMDPSVTEPPMSAETMPIDLGGDTEAMPVADPLVSDSESEEPVDSLEIPAGEKKVTVSIQVEGKNDKRISLQEANMLKLLKASQSRNKLHTTANHYISEAKNTKSLSKRTKILSEAAKLLDLLIINEDRTSLDLAKKISKLIKENQNMSRRLRRNTRQKNARWSLFEGEDLGADVDVDAASSALEDLGAALGLDVAVEDEAGAEDLGGEEDMEAEEELDLELEQDEMSMMELDMDETMHDEGMRDEGMRDEGMREADADEDEVLEISETMLRRELLRMTESRRPRANVRRQPSRRRRLRENAVDSANSFGGGVAEQEMFVEVDEETLLNALAEELGGAVDQNQNTISPEGGADKMASNFGGGSVQPGVVPESRRRRAANRTARQLAEAKRQLAANKKQIDEMNLFNAKLLYVNKLMQNQNLSQKQQRAIVEALDNAKTLREAKLLYKSLTESLKKRASANLNESRARVLGSSSKSLQSGSPKSSGAGVDRWAILAGLKK